jgi:translation initiation factor 5A
MQLSLMDESGNNRDDLTLPKGTDDAEKLARQIQEDFEAGKEISVTVLKVRLLHSGIVSFLTGI